MQVKKIKIKNYKKLINIDLCLEKDITLIAGPNNAGKTSIVEFLKFLFGDTKDKIELTELNTKLLDDWIEKFYVSYKSVLNKNLNDSKLVDELTSYFMINPINDIQILPEAYIEISYNKKDDQLSDIIRYSFELEEYNSIYFKYLCKLNDNKFKSFLIENNKKIISRYKNKNINDKQKKLSIKKILSTIFQNSIDECYYYTNSLYLDECEIKKAEFKQLFNIRAINALRKLDDNKNDSNYSLSKTMINIASKTDEYKTKLEDISDDLFVKLEENNIEKAILAESISKFNDELKLTSGSESFAKIGLLINPETEDINNLLKDSTTVQYNVENFNLGEYSQGLGYSNMVYMHMSQQNFEKNIDPSKINIMIIEEPESHMHPQMQTSFFKKILSFYNKNISQCIISTHSVEIVNHIEDINKLRVIRNTKNLFEAKLYDLREFVKLIQNKKYDEITDKLDFYNFFFTIGFPNLIFSNKAILFEGDSERILLKYIIRGNYENLYNDYISYVQVGGAYAKNYFDLLKFLNIKTLVLTDIDYKKDVVKKDEILKSTSSNATLNYSFRELSKFLSNPDFQISEYMENKENAITIEDIYKTNNFSKYDLIRIFTQNSNDKYTRTLEEAMFTKLLNINVWDTLTQEEWKNLRKKEKLKFSIPNKQNITVRDIIQSTSNNKTDFMYSVILMSKYKDMLPNYIKDGLEWLQNE